jgi:prevent-host-death family protein
MGRVVEGFIAMQVNIYEAKTRLSELVEQAHGGDTVLIAKAGTPLAKLVPLSDGGRRPIRFGLMKGEFIESPDFDAPLPDEVLTGFEGGA